MQAAVRLGDASGVPTGTNASGRSPMAGSRACPARSVPVVAAITPAAVLPRDQVAEPKLARVLLAARAAGRSQDPAGTAGSGRCAVIVVPLLGADRTSSRPSRAASLSAILRWPDPIGVQLTS